MEKIYKTEKEGQIAFFDNYNVPWQENDGVLVENCDGIYNGVLFEFKLNINGEREVRGRRKVARGSESPFVHCTQPYGFACQPLRGLVTSRNGELSKSRTRYFYLLCAFISDIE